MRVAPRVHAAAAVRTGTATVVGAVRRNLEWRPDGGKLLLAKTKRQ
jgi:hypothetical protein